MDGRAARRKRRFGGDSGGGCTGLDRSPSCSMRPRLNASKSKSMNLICSALPSGVSATGHKPAVNDCCRHAGHCKPKVGFERHESRRGPGGEKEASRLRLIGESFEAGISQQMKAMANIRIRPSGNVAGPEARPILMPIENGCRPRLKDLDQFTHKHHSVRAVGVVAVEPRIGVKEHIWFTDGCNSLHPLCSLLPRRRRGNIGELPRGPVCSFLWYPDSRLEQCSFRSRPRRVRRHRQTGHRSDDIPRK
jgi:hypothetical protein